MELQRRAFLTLGAAMGLTAVGAAPGAEAAGAGSAATQTMYLTGTDTDNTVPWDFMCTAGRKAGVWGTVPTPGCWEFSGFGTYNYGGTLTPGENGQVPVQLHPAGHMGRAADLPGLRGLDDRHHGLGERKPVGPVHQGAFYRFRYDVTARSISGSRTCSR